MSQHPATLPLESVRDLMAPGAPLPFRVIDAQGRLLLAQGQCVLDVRQLKALLERGACIAYKDVQALRQAREKGGGGGSSAAPSTRKLTWFDRWESHMWDIDDGLRQVGHDPAAAPLLAQRVQRQMALVTSQPDAALFTLLRQDDQRMALRALSHARHTSLVVQLTTVLLGWAAERVQCAVAVALTMNASIVDLQARMADQADPPSKKQLDQIRTHPAKSAEMLRASGSASAITDTDTEWLTGVEDHHEQKGGGGYPRAIDAPGEIACVMRAADVYAAKLSPRALRPALPPQVNPASWCAALLPGLGPWGRRWRCWSPLQARPSPAARGATRRRPNFRLPAQCSTAAPCRVSCLNRSSGWSTPDPLRVWPCPGWPQPPRRAQPPRRHPGSSS